MAEERPRPSLGLTAQRTADRLALALEEVGFDVGRAFPLLRPGLDRRGGPGVHIGPVSAPVADRLSAVLAEAARLGVSTPNNDPPDAAGPHVPA